MLSSKRKANLNKNISLTLMALPALVLVIIFKYLPMFGLVIAFKDFKFDVGILKSEWVGFKNFEFFFKSNDAAKVIGNTVLINGLFIITVILGAVILAILLNEILSKRLVKIYQTTLLLPYFLSITVVANIVFGFLDYRYGILNQLYIMLDKEPKVWYNESGYWRSFLIIINWWKNVGYNMIIFYAGVIGIDPTYYEAASVDGAKKYQIFMKITIPLMIPLVITMFLLSAGSIITADIGMFYVVPKNSALLYDKIDVIDSYVYRLLIGANSDIGMTAAIGMFQSVVGFVLVVVSNFFARKYNESSALF